MSLSQTLTVFHLTQDLMAAAQVRAWTGQQGGTYRMFPSLEQLKDFPTDSYVDLLAIDLQLQQLDLSALTAWCSVRKQAGQLSKVTCYAQHVEESLLATARQFGFDSVLTRGQFIRSLAPRS
ncbi:MAG TPA: hypothetical protein PKD54_04935 [Pirellulaceae bacterium]|nr:hypothetical protein [Pirellulaceae bacterium]